jgi:protein-L-isoaspartate O-methyltransferase
MIQLLKLDELKNVANVKILEIGTASGYNAVLLADSLTNLKCHNNTVYTIEFRPSLIPKAIHNISKFYKMKSKPARMTQSDTPQKIVKFATSLGRIVLYKGDGTQPLGVIYDRIIVTAGGDELPLTFIKDLKSNGVLVMPVQKYLVIIVKLTSASTRKPISSIRQCLNKMISQNIEHTIVNFKGLYSLSITVDIPVRFVPLKYTRPTSAA